MIPIHFARQSAAALVACLLVTACGKGRNAPPSGTATSSDSSVTVTDAQRAQIVTAAVEEKTFSPFVTTTGTINFNGEKSTQVLSSISGPVVRLLVDLGDSVTRGEPLATVSSPDFAAAVAGYRKADAMWRNAERIATRDEKLFANDALARSELDQAKIELATAAADRDAGIQQLYALGVDSASVEAIRESRAAPGTQPAIRAPIPGVIVERLVTPGQLLQAGATPTFTIADLSSVWVIGSVVEGDIGLVRVGSPAMITLMNAAADSFPGRVNYVGAEVDPASKATSVRIVVPNRGTALRGNMLVRVEIRGTTPRRGIVIPVSAVLRDTDNLPFVYLAMGKNRFNRRRITLGDRTGNQYEVLGGLRSGELIVTQGALYVNEVASQ